MLFSTALTRLISELAATPKIRVPTYADNAPTWSRHRQLETYRKYLQRALNILEAYRKKSRAVNFSRKGGLCTCEQQVKKEGPYDNELSSEKETQRTQRTKNENRNRMALNTIEVGEFDT